ncbi:uncharacterized protein LOC108677402 isoform X2 [Hyalella azteca]|uniref:Uncharacterized protein LOC108677402 isoform X2 n=1 Tax=Hyalella azteca TaxID=294128 RepID=A0A8B7P4X9_HYAAZ|nr:uncharacterized protein LOC108677402 isoform X2 [Hyalella azteca]
MKPNTYFLLGLTTLVCVSFTYWLAMEHYWQPIAFQMTASSATNESEVGPPAPEAARLRLPTTSQDGTHLGYLIDTPSCRMPDYDPYDVSIKKFIKKPFKMVCNPENLSPFTFTEGFRIKINEDPKLMAHYDVTLDSLSCCVHEITRTTQSFKKFDADCDNKYKTSKCHLIVNGSSAEVATDGAFVVCSKNNSISKPFYKNVHYFFHTEKIRDKIAAHKERLESSEALPLNFILMGIDSTSRQNLRRFFPETFKFLSDDPSTLDFMGYNKVADNTDVNVSPVIMGNRAEDLMSFKLDCYKKQKANFDSCPFIWKNFSAQGYATVYSEDAPSMGLYHFNKIGFVQPPVDFYARPYMLLSEKEIGHPKDVYNHYCYGLQASTEVVYDQIMRALDNLSDQVPVFGYFWSATYTHGSNQNAAPLDKPTLRFLEKFTQSPHRNNTILLFFSDHGLRFGDIRSTYLGALEERLPFVTMLFPPWFKDEFPETWRNLLTNQRRLTNNYDLHSTLLDILHGAYNASLDLKTLAGRGQSLFLEVPTNRTCESIHIPWHYCACQSSLPANTQNSDVKQAAQVLTQAINKLIEKHPECSRLEIKEIISAREYLNHEKFGEGTVKKKLEKWTTYSVMIETTPGGGHFEGSVVKGHNKSWKVLEDISRINLYGNQSTCIEDTELKKICHCR